MAELESLDPSKSHGCAHYYSYQTKDNRKRHHLYHSDRNTNQADILIAFRNCVVLFRLDLVRQIYLVDICSDKDFNVAAGTQWPLLAGQLVVQLKMLALLLPLLLVVAGAAPASASASGNLPSCENALPPGEGFGGSVVITSDCIWRPQLHFINTLTGEQRPDYAGALEAPTIYYEPAAVTSQSGVWDINRYLLRCCSLPASPVQAGHSFL